MYISCLKIVNYRCFPSANIDLRPGVNVFIGENNAGKTAVLSALGLIFNQGSRRRPLIHDFFQGIKDYTNPPEIQIQATLRSSDKDTLSDKALVATWLTKIESPWEATLTYRCFLPLKEATQFQTDLDENPTRERFWSLVDRYLPKFVTRIFGGNPADQLVVEGESLGRFSYQFVDAVRDVRSTMFSGQDPLLKEMLHQVLDSNVDSSERNTRQDEFARLAQGLHSHIINRLDREALFQLVKRTGAADGGSLDVEGMIAQSELLAALRLMVEREGFRLPVVYNGLGYNNLVFISLLLAKMDYAASVDRNGQEGAVVFPMLAIEEPEAHLHPALQYRLLKYLRERIEDQTNTSRQVFVTTHSTHITAACELDDIICLSAPSSAEDPPHVAYPGKVFGSDPAGIISKKYVERFLDATKSNMLFARGVVLVEGIAEQLVLPCLADRIGLPVEEGHVAIIAVGGSTFAHFLPLFGAGPEDARRFALKRRIACILDSDPCMKQADDRVWKTCWPYCATEVLPTEFRAISPVVERLREVTRGVGNITVECGSKTFEYDLAEANPHATWLISERAVHGELLLALCADPAGDHDELMAQLDGQARAALAKMDDAERLGVIFASLYLHAVEKRKGENAFDVAVRLRALASASEDPVLVTVPGYIRNAIEFVSPEILEDAQ